MGKSQRKGFETALSKKVGRAIADYQMLKDKDRILVAVSGGKDSLALLKFLVDRRTFVPIHYDLVALHVDLDHRVTQIETLKTFVEKEGCPFYVKRLNVRGQSQKKSFCFWCSWNRRKVLFAAAKKYHCTKIALGHHKDDIAETILMNILFEGQISAMMPYQEMFKRELSLIRPLAYVEESEITKLARRHHFPDVESRCSFSQMSMRSRVKSFINTLRDDCPGVKTNILKSLGRIKKDYLLELPLKKR
jgi:tRNA 2-thiocytidine biosynthesis protein TtcA